MHNKVEPHMLLPGLSLKYYIQYHRIRPHAMGQITSTSWLMDSTRVRLQSNLTLSLALQCHGLCLTMETFPRIRQTVSSFKSIHMSQTSRKDYFPICRQRTHYTIWNSASTTSILPEQSTQALSRQFLTSIRVPLKRYATWL